MVSRSPEISSYTHILEQKVCINAISTIFPIFIEGKNKKTGYIIECGSGGEDVEDNDGNS